MTSLIPEALRHEIERQAGGVIVAETLRGGGGASRQGAEVTLRQAGGADLHCYLAWDSRAADPARLPFFERETGVLAALSGPLAGCGVQVAPLLASDPAHLALLSVFIAGDDRFARAADPAALARDFVAQLAALHRVDAAHPALAALGDIGVPVSAQIAARLAQLRADNLATAPDPILQLALGWLADNVPPDQGPAVVLHGDAGPGNFLHDGTRVTALVDWELAHLGDPMEDLAQIWVRSLIQPFVPMRDVFAAYAAAGGVPVDLVRIKYHRLYFQIGFSVAGHAAQYGADAPQSAMIGASLMFNTMHRRIIVASLAELTGQVLIDPVLPDCPAGWTDRTYAAALDDLRDEIVPALPNQRATAKAKSLARLVKFWRRRDRYGAAFDQAELAEIGAFLGLAPNSLAEARSAFGQAVAERRVDRGAALQLCHNRVVRETFLMADAMGALATTQYERWD